MADFRAELAALVAAYDGHRKWMMADKFAALQRAVDHARDVLAQPEPAGAAATAAVAAAIAAGQPVTLPSGTVIADPAWFESRIAIHAALAQPVPAPAPDGEVTKLVEAMRELAYDGGSDTSDLLHCAADLLERQALRPIPVSERLPGPKDCVPHPRTKRGNWCWGFERCDVSLARPARWRLMHMEAVEMEASHWLPAHALPLPEFE